MISFKDRPCGSGKTTEMIRSLDPLNRYMIVVPFLSECNRVIAEASIPISTPPEEDRKPKGVWLAEAVANGDSIVCTHALFDQVDLKKVDLSDYHVIIDEVFDCVDAVHGITDSAFERVYLGDGYATIDLATGKVVPTDKWHSTALMVAPTIRLDLYQKACNGCLFKVDGQGFFVSLVPPELFTSPASCTVLTYLAECSVMAGYLKRLGIPFHIDSDQKVSDAFKASLKQRLSVYDIPALRTIALNHVAQERMKAAGAMKVAQALKNLKGRCMDAVKQANVMVSCNKEKWLDHRGKATGDFARDSRFIGANFVAKTTRGTNKYRHCSHAIYLNDLRLNPSVKVWLGWTKDDEDAWAVSELVQWVMRCRLRDGDPATLYLASPRMLKLFQDWLGSVEEETIALAA